MVEQSVCIYNHERPHATLKWITPDAAHRAFQRMDTVNLSTDLARWGGRAAYFHYATDSVTESPAVFSAGDAAGRFISGLSLNVAGVSNRQSMAMSKTSNRL